MPEELLTIPISPPKARRGWVVTATGREVKPSNIVTIDGKYYEKGVDAVYIFMASTSHPLDEQLDEDSRPGKQWVLKTDLRIGQDIISGDWYLRTQLTEIKYTDKGIMKTGLVRKDSKHNFITCIDNSTAEYQFHNPFTATLLVTEPDIAKELGFSESIKDGKFYKIIGKQHLGKNPSSRNFTLNNDELRSFHEKELPRYTEIANRKPIIPDLLPYTFGLEIETINGVLPTWLAGKLPINAEHDGSIGNGSEFVTVPLQGNTGLYILQDILAELKKRCSIDQRCGVHVHLSGFGDIDAKDRTGKNQQFVTSDISKQLIVALYHLGIKIQDELFLMLPASRKKPEYAKLNLSKNYCANLPAMNKSTTTKYLNSIKDRKSYHVAMTALFQQIYKVFTERKGHSDGLILDKTYNRRSRLHPETNKWKSQRYVWLNFIPLLFEKSGTIEARNHSASFNFEKITNWLMIFMGIVVYAKKYPMKCIDHKVNITLFDIMTDIYPKSGKMLCTYITKRRKKFAKGHIEGPPTGGKRTTVFRDADGRDHLVAIPELDPIKGSVTAELSEYMEENGGAQEIAGLMANNGVNYEELVACAEENE